MPRWLSFQAENASLTSIMTMPMSQRAILSTYGSIFQYGGRLGQQYACISNMPSWVSFPAENASQTSITDRHREHASHAFLFAESLTLSSVKLSYSARDYV